MGGHHTTTWWVIGPIPLARLQLNRSSMQCTGSFSTSDLRVSINKLERSFIDKRSAHMPHYSRPSSGSTAAFSASTVTAFSSVGNSPCASAAFWCSEDIVAASHFGSTNTHACHEYQWTHSTYEVRFWTNFCILKVRLWTNSVLVFCQTAGVLTFVFAQCN